MILEWDLEEMRLRIVEVPEGGYIWQTTTKIWRQIESAGNPHKMADLKQKLTGRRKDLL